MPETMTVTSGQLLEVARELRFSETLAELILEASWKIAAIEELARQGRARQEDVSASPALSEVDRGRLKTFYSDLDAALRKFDALEASLASRTADRLVDELVDLQGRLEMELGLRAIDG